MIEPILIESVAEQNLSLPHVLLVVDQFPRSLGGGERVVLRLAALLPLYGYRVSILTFAVDPQSGLFAAPPHCPVYLLPLRRTYDLTALRAAFELAGFLEWHQVRIVQTFFESSDIWAGCVVKLLSHAKLVWSRRDMGILRARKHRIFYRLMAGAPDRVFTVSEQVRRYTIEVDRIAPERVETIYNGLDLRIAPGAREERTDGGFVVTTLGNIRRVKGHDILIRAASAVVREFPDASFYIAGEVLEQDYFAELQTLIRDLQLTGRVHFLGGISDVPAHLATADVFVLPSRSEGFSNAIIEAMAAALPVVATDVGGNAEAVRDGLTGWIVPPEDETALADAILKLLRDPPWAMKIGMAGRARATANFTIEGMMRRTVEAYRELLGVESRRGTP